MKIACLWTTILVIISACKPIARQEPVSEEQSLLVLKKLIVALERANLDEAQRLIFAQERMSSIKDLVGEASARGYTNKLAMMVENYRVPLPASDEINKRIASLHDSFDSDTFIAELTGIRDITKKTYLEFKKLETVIKSSSRNLEFGSGAYARQLEQLQMEFKNWSTPLIKQVDGEVTRFLQGGHQWKDLSNRESMRVVDEVLSEWRAIKKMLDNKFE